MEKYSFHSVSLESIERLFDAQSYLRRRMIARLTTADFRMYAKPRCSPSLAEAGLRSTRSIRSVVTGRVDMPVSAVVECIQKGLNIVSFIEVYNSRILGIVTKLRLFSWQYEVQGEKIYVLCVYRE